MKVFIDGEPVEGADASVPVNDHGLLYGDGVFEGIRAFDRRAFRLDLHLERLGHGARALHLEVPGGAAAMREVVQKVLDAHGDGDAYLRLIVTRGAGPLGIDPTQCERPRVICIADRIALFSDAQRRAGLSMITSSVRRPPADVLDPRVKTLNYLNNVMARGEARRQGADEALMLNLQGQVAEATVANVFVVREGVLMTPPTSDGALDGITRRAVLELAAARGIETRVQTLGRMDIFGADECFMTGSGAGVVRIASLDGEALSRGEPGPITEQLASAHQQLLRA
ncbi:MAG: branched-chain-amino-acid transaminase [Myxococcales bacterium]|nr:branched-chain-amino-acid transaminase [Myxococcales bacterium]